MGIFYFEACSSIHHKRFADAKGGSNVAFVVQNQVSPLFTLAKCKQMCTDAGRLCSAVYMYTNKFGETKCNGLKHVGFHNHYASKPTDKVDYSFVKVDNPGVKTCAQLGWRRVVGANSVDSCGSSAAEIDPSGAPICHRNVGHALANSVCQKVGARLCSVSEVQGGAVADGSKCNYNAELVWTDTPCYLQGTDSFQTHGYFASTGGGGNGYTSCKLATGSFAASSCCAGGWSAATFSSAASFQPQPPPPPLPPLPFLAPPPPPSQKIIPYQPTQLQGRSVAHLAPSPADQRARPFDDTAARTYTGGVAAPTSTAGPTTLPRDTNGDLFLPVGQRVYILWDDGQHYFATVVAARPPGGEHSTATYDVSFEIDRSMGYYLNPNQHMIVPVGGVSSKSGSKQRTGTPTPPRAPATPLPPTSAPPVYRTGTEYVNGIVITNSDGTMTHVASEQSIADNLSPSTVLMSEPTVMGDFNPSAGSKLARFIKFFVVASVAAVMLILALQHSGVVKRIRAAHGGIFERASPSTPEPEKGNPPQEPGRLVTTKYNALATIDAADGNKTVAADSHPLATAPFSPEGHFEQDSSLYLFFRPAPRGKRSNRIVVQSAPRRKHGSKRGDVANYGTDGSTVQQPAVPAPF